MRKYAAVGSAVLLLALAAALPLYSADAAPSAAPKGFQAITKPSKDVTVSFTHPGRILKVLAGMGDPVTEGQLLAQQDSDEAEAANEVDRRAAENKIEILAEEKIREQKVKDLEGYMLAGSKFEQQNAELEVAIEGYKIEIAKFHHEQAKIKYKQSSILVEKFKVLAPISGEVQQEFLKAGESAEGGNMKLVRIVQNDPLWIDVPVPSALAHDLVAGAPATISYKNSKIKDQTGKVAALAPMSDAPSDTTLVRVEVPNPQKLPSGELDPRRIRSGEIVFVNFPSQPGGVARP